MHSGSRQAYSSLMPSDTRKSPLVLRSLRYLGGHPSAPSELDRVDVFFDVDGIEFKRKHERLGSIPWDEVTDLSADAESTTRRMTVPRVWLLGVFAALFPTRERHVLLRVSDRRGPWMFEVSGIRLGELRKGIAKIRRQHDL